jgi:hypothetical protein
MAVKSKRISWTGQVAFIANEKCVQNFVGKSKGTIPFGRDKTMW